MARVAVYLNNSVWPYPLYCSELEIIQNHLSRGDEVFVVGCDGQKNPCFINPTHSKWKCYTCKTIRDRGLEIVKDRVKFLPIYHLTASELEKINSIFADFSTNEEVKAFKFGEFDLGYASLSSMISQLRDPYPDLKVHSNYLKALMRTSASVYLSTRKHIREQGIQEVYVFNGRFHDLKAVFRAAQHEGAKANCHERGANIFKYHITEGALLHDLKYNETLIKRTWAQVQDRGQALQVARNFYEERAVGSDKNQSWISFTQNQIDARLPASWDASKRNYVIFVSSEDEYEAIGPDWDIKPFPNQLTGIQFILDELKNRTDPYQVYVRVHPFLRSVSNPYLNRLLSMSDPRLEMIGADSSSNTYSLLRAANVAVSFGSTTSIEAAYFGTPSILLGPAYFQNLGSVYKPESPSQVRELLLNNPSPLPKEGALMFGYHMATFGHDYRHYQPKTFSEGAYPGVDLEGWIGKLRKIRRKLSPVKEF